MNVLNPWTNPSENPQKYAPYYIPTNHNVGEFEGPIPMNATKETIEKENIESTILSKYQLDFKCSGSRKRLLMMNQRMIFDEYADKSPFYNNYDDGNMSEHQKYVDSELNNPQEYYDKDNVLELDAYIRDINTMAKQVMTDAGVAKFNYEYSDEDNVNLFQESNQSYYKAMNIYNTAPQHADIATMIKNMEDKKDFKKLV